MKKISYEKVFKIQNQISIDNLIQIHYSYGELNTIISHAPLEDINNLEEFICMIWKKDFYEDDKFDYTLHNKEKGLIKLEDLPSNNDFLIDIRCTSIKQVLKTYLRGSDNEKLNLNFKAINNCAILSSNKDYNFYKNQNIPYGLTFIFKDEKKIYMLENCIDC